MALGQQGQLGQLQHVSWVNNDTTTAGSCTYYSVLNIFLPQYLRLHGAAMLVTSVNSSHGGDQQQFQRWFLFLLLPAITSDPGHGHTGQWSQETGHWSAPSPVVTGTSCPPCPAPTLELPTNFAKFDKQDPCLSVIIFLSSNMIKGLYNIVSQYILKEH